MYVLKMFLLLGMLSTTLVAIVIFLENKISFKDDNTYRSVHISLHGGR